MSFGEGNVLHIVNKHRESLVVDDATELIVDFRAGLEQIQDLLVFHLRDKAHTNLASQSCCLLVNDLLIVLPCQLVDANFVPHDFTVIGASLRKC